MDPKNPYAPPVDTADAPPGMVPDTGGLALSEQGWATVTSLAKWMRVVGVFFYIAGAFSAMGVLAMIVSGGTLLSRSSVSGMQGGMLILGGLVMVIWTFFFFFGAAWIRSAAWHFYDGVRSNAEHALAHGFRKLRLYLIFYGILGIVDLLHSVLEMIQAS